MYQNQNVDIHFAHLRPKLVPNFRLAGYTIPAGHLHEWVEARSPRVAAEYTDVRFSWDRSVADAIRAIEAD